MAKILLLLTIFFWGKLSLAGCQLSGSEAQELNDLHFYSSDFQNKGSCAEVYGRLAKVRDLKSALLKTISEYRQKNPKGHLVFDVSDYYVGYTTGGPMYPVEGETWEKMEINFELPISHLTQSLETFLKLQAFLARTGFHARYVLAPGASQLAEITDTFLAYEAELRPLRGFFDFYISPQQCMVACGDGQNAEWPENFHYGLSARYRNVAFINPSQIKNAIPEMLVKLRDLRPFGHWFDQLGIATWDVTNADEVTDEMLEWTLSSIRTLDQHKGLVKGFVQKYNVRYVQFAYNNIPADSTCKEGDVFQKRYNVTGRLLIYLNRCSRDYIINGMQALLDAP